MGGNRGFYDSFWMLSTIPLGLHGTLHKFGKKTLHLEIERSLIRPCRAPYTMRSPP
jgi:hypothetical protein